MKMDDLISVATEPKAPPPKPNVLTFKLDVPVGHVLPITGAVEPPFDMTVEEPFSVTVVAGARWHPEWGLPRIAVNAFLILPQGDAVCWAGEEAKALPLPDAVRAMADFHGEEMDEHLAFAVAGLGLSVPDKPEPYSAFHAKRVTNEYTLH